MVIGMDFPGRLMAGFLAILLLFIFPLQYIAQSNTENIDTLIGDRTHELTDSIRRKGYLNKQMYEDYVGYLDTAGERYDIEIQDIKAVKGEEHSYNGIQNDRRGTASFERMSHNHNEIQSFAAHIHTEDCFAGHNHEISGCTDGYVCHDGKLIRSLWHGYTNDMDIRYRCSICEKIIIRFTADWFSTNTNYFIWTLRWNSNANDYVLTKSNYFIDSDYEDKGYPVVYNLFRDANNNQLPLDAKKLYKNYPAFNFVGNFSDSSWISTVRPPKCEIPNDTNPICNQVVTSITATNSNQTVNKGNPIITTATAAYLDGHTAVVNCTSNYNPNAVGSQTVTLTYTGLVGNAKTTGTRTCTINVTVKSLKDLASITVTPASQSIQKYTAPSFTVRANYSDGTNKLLNSSEYSMTGLNARKTGTQNVTISYTEGGITKSATVKVTVTVLQRECPKCSNIYELNPDDTDPGCPFCEELIAGIEVRPDVVEVMQGESLPVTVDAIYNNGSRKTVTAWTSNYDSQRTGMQTVTIEYGGYAAIITVWVSDELIKCPVCDTKYPPSESCPVCAEKVVRISASPKEITVIQYETVVLAVTAFYADGKSSVVDGWAVDTSTASPGRFMATVSYKGASDMIILNVLSINTVECPICGTVYELSENPKGCPICANELTGIEAYLTSGTNLVQLGIIPDIAVIIIFRDEHREFAEEGYQLENFNPQELGIQTIKVLYKGFSTTVIVEVVNMFDTTICPNGHVYHKNADGTDPGCPFCPMSEETGKVIYFDITYTTEILDIVYSMGEYHFQEGNYISIIITKKDKSLLYRLQKTFFETSLLGRKKRFIYGGEVTKHE